MNGNSMTDFLNASNITVDSEMILLMYEIQSGSYTTFASQNSDFVHRYNSELADLLQNYVLKKTTILDCGTGEATNLLSLLKHFSFEKVYAIDISLSRLLWANQNSIANNIEIEFAVGSIFEIPLPDNSIDIVLTNHALEPNGGQEYKLISELGRVSAKYIFLVEPDYETASVMQKVRMDRLNFVKNLDSAIHKCGYKIIKKIPILNFDNPENKAMLRIIDVEKNLGDSKGDKISNSSDNPILWVEPISKESLRTSFGGLRSDTGLWFPIIGSIPLLKKEDGQLLLSPPIV
jgi:ubiquinone/menaquinone biosynthesis C-methylase UbiE